MKNLLRVLTMITLTAALICTSFGAVTAVSYTTGGGFLYYVGSDARLHTAQSQETVLGDAVRSLLCADEENAYALTGTAATPQSLTRIPVDGSATETICEGVREDAVYADVDGQIYFVTTADPSTLLMYNLAHRSLTKLVLPSADGTLSATADGLIYTANGVNRLYVPSVGRFMDTDLDANALYETYDAIQTRLLDGTLSIRAKGEFLYTELGNQVLATAYANATVYFLRQEDETHLSIRAYRLADQFQSQIARLEGDYYATLTADAQGLYVLSKDHLLHRIDPATGALTTLKTLDNRFENPALHAEDGFVFATDETSDHTISAIILTGAPETTPEPASTPEPTKAPAPEDDTLRRGDTGNRVTKLQNRLSDLGYPVGKADGQYGGATFNAIRYFQDAAGLRQSGVADKRTQDKLFAASAPEYEAYRPLKKGDTGIRVEALQNRLTKLKYFSSEVDGDYGEKTAKAVRLFQGDNGYDETGSITARQLKLLFSKDADAYTPYVKLRLGDEGERVKTLQARLKKLGYFTGNVLGHFQEKTEAAVKRFQTQVGLKADGIASVETLKKLYAKNAPSYNPNSTAEPTDSPTGTPTESPTATPSESPTATPSESPTATPSESPTATPSESPTATPSESPTAPVYVELKKDDQKPEVEKLKTRLFALGYLAEDPTLNAQTKDLFDTLTEDAVKLAQTALSYQAEKINGIASIEFQTALFAQDMPVYVKP